MDKVLILGNGITRKENYIESYIRDWKDEIWVCNWAFKESTIYPITRVGTVHDDVIVKALEHRTNFEADYTIWTLESVLLMTPIQALKRSPLIKKFVYKKGYTTGTLMLLQALYEKKEVYLAGFDMGGPDIYQETDRPSNTFRTQFRKVVSKLGIDNIHFVGDTPPLDNVEYEIRNDRWKR